MAALFEHGGDVYFSNVQRLVGELFPMASDTYAAWLAVRLASSVRCEVAGDTSLLFHAYAEYVEGPNVAGRLIIDVINTVGVAFFRTPLYGPR